MKIFELKNKALASETANTVSVIFSLDKIHGFERL